MKIFSFTTLLLLMQSLGVSAQPKVITETDSREAFLGDAVTLNIRVLHEDGWTFHEPLMDEKLGDAVVLGQTWTPPVRDPEAGLNRLNFQVRLAWYKLGDYTIPPFEVTATGPDGKEQTFETTELSFEVVPMLKEDDLEPAPSKGQVQLDSIPLWPFAVIAILAVLIALGVVWWLFRPKDKGPAAAPPVPLLPPEVEALKALEALTHGPLLKEGDYKGFYVAVNLIIRRYYSRLYNINAEEMTSFEVEDWMAEQANLPAAAHDLNRDFQEACDRVKFAKHDPVEAENKETVNRAYQIIELLKPKEVANVSAG